MHGIEFYIYFFRYSYIYIYVQIHIIHICVCVCVHLEFNQQNGEFSHHQITFDRNIWLGFACSAVFGIVFHAGFGFAVRYSTVITTPPWLPKLEKDLCMFSWKCIWHHPTKLQKVKSQFSKGKLLDFLLLPELFDFFSLFYFRSSFLDLYVFATEEHFPQDGHVQRKE